MTQVAAIPYEFTVGTTPSKLAGVNLTAAILDIQNKSTAGADLRVKFGSAFTVPASSVQTITFLGTPDGGTWTVKDAHNNVTSALAANINAATLQTALEGLGDVGSGNVLVSGAMPSFALTFRATLANTPMAALIVTSSLTLSTGQANAVQVVSFSLPPTAGTLTFGDSAGNYTSALTASTLTPLLLAAALNALPAINGAVANITQNNTTKAFTIAFGAPLGNQPVPLLLVIGTALVTTAPAASAAWTVRCAPSPAAGTSCLSYGSDLTGPLAYNISAANLQTALEGLPGIGAGNVLVAGSSLYAGFTVTLRSALANTANLPLGQFKNFLGRNSYDQSKFASGQVAIVITQTVVGVASVPVVVSAATSTPGVAPSAVGGSLVVTTPGVAGVPNEGWLIPAGGSKPFENGAVPIDGLWAVASADATPVVVLAG